MKQDFTILFGGEAGYGTMSAGSLVAKAAVRKGFWAHNINEFPSLIKGGLNTSHVAICPEKITSTGREVDFVGVVSQPALDINLSRLKEGGILLYDNDSVKLDETKLPKDSLAIGISFNHFLPDTAAKVMSNAILLGAFSALTGFPKEWLRNTLIEEFKNKQDVANLNGELFDKAFDSQANQGKQLWNLEAMDDKGRLIMNGNDAIALGALSAGVRFSAGYPMTPGTSVLSYLSDHGTHYGLVFKQTEDEIAAMNMLAGASFAGARVIGSTSGGGFALMTEALGYVAQAELPVTMVIAQRGGPSTGLPTRTMQSDLQVALYSGAGEFPRIVVAPGSVEECFYETFKTINLADQYQLPAIILTDKELADSTTTIEPFETASLKNERKSVYSATPEDYKRYADTPDGISPRTLPGMPGGGHIATSYTHQEDGFYSSGNKEYAEFEPEITRKSIDKTYRKFKVLSQELAETGAILHGPANADLTIVGWGGTKGAILEALQLAEKENLSMNYLQVLYMSPFPTEKVTQILTTAKKMLLIEGNATGQLGNLIRQESGIHLESRYLKYDSRRFTPSGILEKVREVLSK